MLSDAAALSLQEPAPEPSRADFIGGCIARMYRRMCRPAPMAPSAASQGFRTMKLPDPELIEISSKKACEVLETLPNSPRQWQKPIRKIRRRALSAGGVSHLKGSGRMVKARYSPS